MGASRLANLMLPPEKTMTKPYYRPSGRVPAAAYPVAVLMSAGLLPFAWLYAWLIIHAPLVFNVFIAFGFALAIGWLTKCVAAVGKVRDPGWISRAGVVLAVLGWYVQWAAWAALTICAARAAPAGATFFTFLLHPWLLIGCAVDIAATGTMTIAGWPLKGIWLAGIWVIELGMHLMLAPVQGRMRVDEPFCELTNAWAEKFLVPRQFLPLDAAPAASRLEADPDAVWTLLSPMATDASVSHAELILYRTGGADAYISITNVLVKPGKKGQVARERETVTECLRLPGTNVDALIEHLMTQAPAAPDPAAEPERPVSPVLAAALEHLQAERYAEALATASAYVSSRDSDVRPDALRLCALACTRLDRWADAAQFFTSLFDDETTSHNALQIATSSVMAGALPDGLRWMEQATTLNAGSKEVPHMTMLISFLTALKNSGQEAAALTFIEQVRKAYTDIGSTDPTVLYANSMPFFGAFLNNSLPFVRASLSPEQGRRWYASMLPSLDQAGCAALSEWMESAFGPAISHA